MKPECPEKESLCGEERVPTNPRCLGGTHPVASAGSQPRDGRPSGSETSGTRARGEHHLAGHKGTCEGYQGGCLLLGGAQKEELKHVWGQGWAGSQNQERNRGPVMVIPLVQGSSLGPFTSGHPFLWNLRPLPSGLAWAWGYAGPGSWPEAAGWAGVTLTRRTHRPAPHLKRL